MGKNATVMGSSNKFVHFHTRGKGMSRSTKEPTKTIWAEPPLLAKGDATRSWKAKAPSCLSIHPRYELLLSYFRTRHELHKRHKNRGKQKPAR